MTIRRKTQSANSTDQNGPALTPNNWSLIRVRDARQSYRHLMPFPRPLSTAASGMVGRQVRQIVQSWLNLDDSLP